MSERVQIAIVGAGPAGLAAAASATAAGASVVVFDENDVPGGQLRYRTGVSRAIVDEAIAAGVEIRTGAIVWGMFANNQLGIETEGGTSTVDADAVILATGSVDRAVSFAGGSLPGVFSARGLQILLRVHGVRPGHRFAIVGGDERVDELTRAITEAGGTVIVVAPAGAALGAIGATGVTSIAIDGASHDVDIVVVSAGRLPDCELALIAECPAGFQATIGAYVPALDDSMATGIPGLFVAGDAAGVCSVEEAIADGRLAGAAAAASIGMNVDLGAARARYEAAAPDRANALLRVSGQFVQVDRVPVGSGIE